jgi:hypothetical protein
MGGWATDVGWQSQVQYLEKGHSKKNIPIFVLEEMRDEGYLNTL